MDYDDFENMRDAHQKNRFDIFQKAFNEGMKRRGSDQTLDDAMGVSSPKTKSTSDSNVPQQLEEAVLQIHQITGEGPETVVLKAVGIYRSIVKYVQAGGSVQFVDADGKAKTLKVRLK
jgi:hypothetical protein